MPDPTNTLGNDDDVKTAPESGDPLEAGRARGQIVSDASDAATDEKVHPDPSGRLQEDCATDPHYASGRHDAAVTPTRPE